MENSHPTVVYLVIVQNHINTESWFDWKERGKFWIWSLKGNFI